METPKKAGIWLRVSTDMQVEADSPAVHRQRAEAFVEFRGWQAVEIYNLSGVSGKSVLEHPETKRMIADVQRGHIDALVFSKLARLARNTRELLEIADIFKAHGAALVSLGENIDTSTPSGQLMYTVIGALAEWERGEISARIAASVPIRAKEGRSLGGKAPWGYQWVDKKLEINEEEAKSITKIFDTVFDFEGNLSQAMAHLNKIGVISQAGTKWQRTTQLKRFLDDPVYMGKRRVNYTKSTGDGKHWVKKNQCEWVTQDVPAIIEPERWQAMQAMRTARAGKHAGRVPNKTSTTLFGGLAVCSCGEKMYAMHKSPSGLGYRYNCRKCRNKAWESELLDGLKDALDKDQVLPTYFDDESDKVDTAKMRKDALDMYRQGEAIKANQDKILDLYVGGEIPKEALNRKMVSLDKQAKALFEESFALNEKAENIDHRQRSLRPAVKNALEIMGVIEQMDYESQRKAINTLVKRVEINENKTTYKLFYATINQQSTNIGSLRFQVNGKNTYSIINSNSYEFDSELFAEKRKNLGWSLERTGAFIGTSISAVCEWENGRKPRPQFFASIKRFMEANLVPDKAALFFDGWELRKARNKAGLTLSELALIIGVGKSALSRWERGEAVPSDNKQSQAVVEFIRSQEGSSPS